MVFSKCQVQQSWIQGLTPGINPFFAFTFTSGKGLHRVGHDWSDLAAAAAAGKLLQLLSPFIHKQEIIIFVTKLFCDNHTIQYNHVCRAPRTATQYNWY